MSKHADLKNILYAFYKSNPQLSKKSIFDKFDGMGVPKSTLYGWLALLEQGDDLKQKPGQGRRSVGHYSDSQNN